MISSIWGVGSQIADWRGEGEWVQDGWEAAGQADGGLPVAQYCPSPSSPGGWHRGLRQSLSLENFPVNRKLDW